MEANEAFARAALYETCRKSRVLNNIDLDKLDIQTLRALVNRSNINGFREFPILLSKFAMKFVLRLLVDSKPTLRKYLDPDNISVALEPDELAYISIRIRVLLCLTSTYWY